MAVDPLAFMKGFQGAQQIQDNALQNRLLQTKLAGFEREQEQTNALNDLYRAAVKPDGTIDRSALISGAASRGLGAQIPDIQTSFAKQDTAQAQLRKAQIENAAKELEALGNLAGTVTDQASYDRALQIARGRGLDVSQFDPVYNPQYVAQFANAALSRKDQLTQELDRMKFDETRRHNKASEQNQATGHAVALRGQDLTAETARRGQDITMRGQDLTDTRAREANALKAAEGKAPTEFQSKAAMFGARAEEADRILSGLDYSPAALSAKQAVSNVPLVGGVLGAAANVVTSPENQRAEQAQRDFINAILRQESGAVIADSEFDNARKQYFPQPGDSKEVIEQKARNRRTAIEGLKRGAGKAAYSAKPSKPSLSDIFGD